MRRHVLQVLVYCPPFYRLFVELGRHLPGPVVGHQTEGSRATPLVDAIIQFLHEFGVKEEERRETGSRSKGKEREEDFDDLDSFMPAYVYDVMKEKKRFASMVVRILGIYVRRNSHENILFLGRTPRRC